MHGPFSGPVVGSFGVIPAALCFSVPVVGSVVTQKEMARPDTKWRVAPVEDAYRGSKGPVLKFPRDPMRGSAASVRVDDPVSAAVLASGPEPTRVGSCNLRPKTLSERFPLVQAGAFSRTEGRNSDPEILTSAVTANLGSLDFSHDDSFQSLRSGSRRGSTLPRSEVITTLVGMRAA